VLEVDFENGEAIPAAHMVEGRAITTRDTMSPRKTGTMENPKRLLG